MTSTRYYTRATREHDAWTARAVEVDTHRVVAVCMSTVGAEDAERNAAAYAGVEWRPEGERDDAKTVSFQPA